MLNLQILTNENFAVLSYLYDRMDAKRVVRTTQQEVGEDMKISRVTINKIFKNLCLYHFVERDKSKTGRYRLSEDSARIIGALRTLAENNSEV